MSDSACAPLPHAFTPLIGRERDVESVISLLRELAGSMVTLVGPAGVGKTRIAIAVAEKLAVHFEQGVAYVDLAPITEPA